MSLLQNIISTTVIVYIVTGILSLFSKKKEKLDKGCTFNYFSLSYRRKMIRTLWMLLIMFISLVTYNWYVNFSFNKINYFNILFNSFLNTVGL